MNYVASGYVETGYVRQDSDVVGNYAFDKYGKFIYVSELATVCDLADLWSRWEDWMLIEDNTKIKPAMKYSGFDPIPSGFTGATFFVYNDWRVVINPAVTAITGVLYSEDYDTGYWTYDDIPLPIYPITVSAVVNTVVVEGGTGTAITDQDKTDIITGVWANVTRTLTEAGLSETDIHTALDTYTNKDDYKADTSTIDLSTVPADVWAHDSRELTVASGLTVAQEQKLDDIIIDVADVPDAILNTVVQ